MNRLTNEQADILRAIRRKVGLIEDGCEEILQTLCDACEHAEYDPDCWVCFLWRCFSDASVNLRGEDVYNRLEGALLNGPHPVTGM